MNTLDDFLDETPENQAKPELSSRPAATMATSQALDDFLDEDRTQLQYSVQQGATADPGQSLRVLRAIGRTRLPREFVERNLDFVEQETAKQDFDPDKFLRESPVVAEWLKDPLHAAAVRDDYSRLSYLERQYRYIGNSFQRGKETIELSKLGQQAMLGTLTPEQRRRQAELEKNLSKADEQGITGFVEQIPGATANQLPIFAQSLEGKVKAAAQGTVVGAAAGATAGAATANPALPAAGATLGAVTGWRYGAAVEAGKMEAALAFLDYEKLKDENGQPLDRQTVLGLAGIVGVVNGALEGLTGIERATDKLPWVRNFSRDGVKQLLASPSVRGAVLTYAKTVGAVMAEEGVTEGLQSMVTAAGKVLAKSTGGPTDILGELFSHENLANAVQEARAGAQGGGGLSAVVAAPTLAADLKQAKQAKQHEQAFMQMGQATKEAKAISQLPDSLKQIVQAATEGGPIETLYVPTEAFNQYFQSKGVDPRQVAEAITGSVESYDQAVATGADFAIKTSDYASKIAGTEHNAFFARELRTAVDQMNAREADEWVQMMDHQAEAQPGVSVSTASDPLAKITQDITGQLQAIGFDPNVIDQYASLFAQRYQARAARRGLGEDPAALFQQANLTVTRQLPEVLRTLTQKTSELDALLNRLRAGDLPNQTKMFGPTLSDFLREKGGVQDQGGELKTLDVDGARKPFQRKMIQAKGLTLDQAAELAAEAGYLPERDIRALLDALDKDARGTPVYSIRGDNAQLPDAHYKLEALRQALADRSIDLSTMTNDQIAAQLGEEAKRQPVAASEGQTFEQAAATATVGVDGIERPANNSTGHAIAHNPRFLENFWRWFRNSQAVDAQGRPLVLYHGTRRADRIGEKFSKKRATSGPMAFFTDEKTIASKYSTSKQDTSISLDERPYESWFKFTPDGARAPVNIDQAWFYLSADQRQKMAELAPQITRDDEGAIILEPGNTRGLGPYDYNIKQYRGNVLRTLVEDWLNSGALFGEEEQFSDVLKLAGFPGRVVYDDPNAEFSGVIPVYLSIQNPLVTNAIPTDVMESLAAQAKRQRAPRVTHGADQWDKRLRDPKEWITQLQEDYAKGANSHVWTSIPDWVTKTLQAHGYDGIRDTGGKMGGQGHDVWVPFDEKQVKSAIGNKGTYSASTANILRQGEKGSITFGDHQTIIRLFNGADLSTVIHESGHLYLNELIDDATTEGTPQALRDDLDTLLKWMKLEVRSADGREAIKAAIQTQHHEQFARGFEAYAMEGKAPSLALRDAFAKFRQWLVHIYKLFRRMMDAGGVLDVQLTNSVREVMDRMIATDEEIDAAAHEAEVTPLFTDAMDAGMSEAQWQNYQETIGKASRTARETLQAKLMKQYTRQQEDWWKEEREKVKQAVTDEVNDQPEYTALAVLRTGKLPDGSDLPEGITVTKLDRQGIADVLGTDFVRRMPKGTTVEKGGMSHETAAQLFGYQSGVEFLVALVNARPKRQLIEAETDRRMTETYGDMRLDGTIHEQARQAVVNEHQEAVIQAELRALNAKRAEVSPFVKAALKEDREILRGSVSAMTPPLAVVREQARKQIARTPIVQLKPYNYFVASQKARKAALAAVGKQDYVTAALAEQKALLNLALYRQATEALEEADSFAEHMRTLAKKSAQERLGKAGEDYLDQINDLLERYDFARVPNRQLAKRESLAKWIERQEKTGATLGEEFDVPDWMLADAKRVNYRQLTPEELSGLKDVVSQIEHFASLKNKLLKAQKQQDKAEAKAALLTALEKNLKDKGPPPLTKAGFTAKDKATRLAQKFDASLLKTEQLVEWLDGGTTGPWHDYLWNGAADAQAAELDATKTITAKVAEAVASIPKDIRAHMLDTVQIPGVQNVVTRKDLLGVALNVGNQSNYDKLLKGMKWTGEQVQAMVDQLTAEELAFVNQIHATLESLWPKIADLQQRLTGLPPEKVQPKAFQAAHGTIEGGYYPVMYSPVLSDQGAMQLASSVGKLVDEGYTRATTPRGHTKSRVEGFARPFDLDVDRLPTHTAGVIKDLTHREWLLDANWIVNDSEIRQALQRRLGDPLTLRLAEWVKQVVNERSQASFASLGVWQQMFEHMRYNATIVAMGFKVSTMLSQLAGVAPAIEVIGGKDHDGARWFARGVGEVLRRPQSAYDFMTAKSGEMRHRLTMRDRDIRDHLRQLEGKTDLLSQIQQTSLMAIGYVELMVSMPSWYGAYYKALNAGMTDEEAVRQGDRAVRLGQGSGGAKDLAAVASRNDPLLRVMTMFYTPFSALYGRLRAIGHDFGGLKDVTGLAVRMFLTVCVAATLGELAAGHGPDKKKDEEWLDWWLKTVAVYPFLSVPFLRDAISTVASDYGYQFTPLAQAAKVTADAVRTSKQVAEGDKEIEALASKSVQAFSYLLGLPTGQLTITGTYLYDLAEGKANPDDLFEFSKGLLYRRTKEERE